MIARDGKKEAGDVRFGLIGAGAIAQAHAEGIRRTEGAELVGVADIRPEAATALAESFGCPAYDDHDALDAAQSCDAYIVSTPPNMHPGICVDLLGRGRHVLCEKPLAIDEASARPMIDAAEESGTLFTMATKFRFVDDVIRARSIVQSGILGDILLFENAFTARVDMSGRWNSDAKISGGGVLIDNGTHSVDLMRYFLGPLTEVQAIEGKRVQGLEVEDTVQIFARSADDVLGTIDLSWTLNKELDTYVQIYGSHGTIKVGWKGSRYRQHTSSDWIEFGSGYDKVSAFSAQIRNFVRAIRGEEPVRVTPEEALASVQLIDAAYRSLRNAKWEVATAAPA